MNDSKNAGCIPCKKIKYSLEEEKESGCSEAENNVLSSSK